MKLALRHSIFIYITVLLMITVFSACQEQEERAPQPEGLSDTPKEQLETIEKRIRQIDPQAVQKRRLTMNGAQGEAEVNYDENGVLMQVSGSYSNEAGDQSDHFFFDEKGELTYSVHRIKSEIKVGGQRILEQQFTYNQLQEVNGASQRFMEGEEIDLAAFEQLPFESIKPDMDAVNNQQKSLLSNYRSTLRF